MKASKTWTKSCYNRERGKTLGNPYTHKDKTSNTGNFYNQSSGKPNIMKDIVNRLKRKILSSKFDNLFQK